MRAVQIQERSNQQKRRPPCRHGGLESREETPKEGICGRLCRTATISLYATSVARAFFIKKRAISWSPPPRGGGTARPAIRGGVERPKFEFRCKSRNLCAFP